MFCIFQQTNAEQPVFIQIEGLDKRFLFCLDVSGWFGDDDKIVIHMNRLYRVSLLGKLDTGEQRGVGFDCGLDGFA